MSFELPSDLWNNISAYLTSHEKLIWTLCAQPSADFPVQIDRSHERKVLSCFLLLPYLSVYQKNPLFFNNDDLTESIYEWGAMDAIERRNDTYEHIRVMAEYLLDDFKMPIYSYTKAIKYMLKGMYSFRYMAKKYILSPYLFNSPLDKSYIRYKKCYISAVYGIRSPSRQIRNIHNSLTLKALVG